MNHPRPNYSPFMARGGIGRPPMPPHHGYGGPMPGYGPPQHMMHQPRYGGPPMMGGGGYGGDGYGGPGPRMRGQAPMNTGGAPQPHHPHGDLPVGTNPERPTTSKPAPTSISAVSELSSSNSKAESIVSEAPTVDEPHNDVEILIINTNIALEKYAETIERHIKSVIGLTCDLMYPNDDVKLQDFLLGLGKRGTKYAAKINGENEVHRSLTLHVLKRSGVMEQTHKNVPLQTAYRLLADGKKALQRSKVSRLPLSIKKSLEDVLSDSMLKYRDYYELIRHLSQRWEAQLAYEDRTEYDDGINCFTPQQLQSKIEKILGVDSNDVTQEENNPKLLSKAVEGIFNNSSVLRTLHAQNQNSSRSAANDTPTRMDSGFGGLGPPKPKFPKSSSSKSTASSLAGSRNSR